MCGKERARERACERHFKQRRREEEEEVIIQQCCSQSEGGHSQDSPGLFGDGLVKVVFKQV